MNKHERTLQPKTNARLAGVAMILASVALVLAIVLLALLVYALFIVPRGGGEAEAGLPSPPALHTVVAASSVPPAPTALPAATLSPRDGAPVPTAAAGASLPAARSTTTASTTPAPATHLPPITTPTPRPAAMTATSLPPAVSAAVAWQRNSSPSDAELEAQVAAMPLKARIGQMMMVGFHGRSVAESAELATMVGDYHVGGVVLLEANAHDPAQLSRLTADLQALATSTGQRIPLFISINQEGGIVVHVTEGVTGFPGNMAVGAAGVADYAYVSAALTAYELRTLGINMNLAPVLDVNDNPLNPVIGTRSFGSDAAAVAEYGRLAVQGTQAAGVIAVAKHFPGHGGVAADSHTVLPVLDSPPEALRARELVPFQAAIEAGVDAIMSAHVAVPALDASGRPATLSPAILTGLLRDEMGFEGLIVTDSLGMGGVRTGRGQPRAAVEAVLAGADVLLSTTPMDEHIGMFEALVAAVRQGEIPEERINRSVLRILRLKYAYGLFDAASPGDLSSVGSAGHRAVADEIARRAVTRLRDTNGSVPLPPPPARLLVISPNELPPPTSGQGTSFAEALRAHGYSVTELVFNLNSQQSRDRVYAQATAKAEAHDIVLFGEWALISRYINRNDTWQERLLAELLQANPRLIVVAWYNPAALVRCGEVPAFLTAYGYTPSQVSAVVAVLTGELAPAGRLPMVLP